MNNVSLTILKMAVIKIEISETDKEIDELAVARLGAFWKNKPAAVELFEAGLDFFNVVRSEQQKEYSNLKSFVEEEFRKTFME